MRLAAIVSFLFLALIVSAEFTPFNQTETNELLLELTKLSTCATNCIATVLPLSKCDQTDFACLCADDAYIEASEECILSQCTLREALSSQEWQKKACQAPVRDHGPLTRRIGDALLIIGVVCILVRFLARWKIQNSSIGWDDWTILASYLLLIPSTALVQVMTYHGMGQDIWTVPFDNLTKMLKIFYIEQYIYQTVVVLTKISIVLLYLRIFPKEVARKFHYVGLGVIVGLFLYLVGFLIYFGFECEPISFFWTQWDGEHDGYCRDTQLAVYLNSGINIVFDLIVFFLPIPKLMRLQVRDTRRKLGAVFTFLLGLFVTACSCVRLKYLTNLGKVQNATWHYNDISLWSGLEGDVGVICACMPTIAGPILYLFRERIGSKLSSKSGKSSRNSFRIPDDESVARRHQHGSEMKKVPTSMYQIPRSQSSEDDVELIIQGPRRGEKKEWDAV